MTKDVLIRFAALAYVRECGRQHQIVDLEVFAQRLWQRDADEARKVKIATLADDIRSGIPVVEVWQRGDVSGTIARQLVDARSYGDLYRVLMVNEMRVAFRPRDVAVGVREGRMSPAEGMEVLGIERADEFEAFLAAWSAGEN